LSISIVHRRVRRTPLMRFSSLTRAVDRTAAACSLQIQAGALAGQAAQSAVQRSPTSVTHIIGYYAFNRPHRDGRLSWPCWLTDSGRHNHKVVKQPSISLAQDKESPPAKTDVLTTMLCHQLCSGGGGRSNSSSKRSLPVYSQTLTALHCDDLILRLVCRCGGIQPNDVTKQCSAPLADVDGLNTVLPFHTQNLALA